MDGAEAGDSLFMLYSGKLTPPHQYFLIAPLPLTTCYSRVPVNFVPLWSETCALVLIEIRK